MVPAGPGTRLRPLVPFSFSGWGRRSRSRFALADVQGVRPPGPSMSAAHRVSGLHVAFGSKERRWLGFPDGPVSLMGQGLPPRPPLPSGRQASKSHPPRSDSLHDRALRFLPAGAQLSRGGLCSGSRLECAVCG